MECRAHLLELARQVSVKTIVKRLQGVPTIKGLLLNKHARDHGQSLTSFTVFDRRIKLV